MIAEVVGGIKDAIELPASIASVPGIGSGGKFVTKIAREGVELRVRLETFSA